MHSMELRYCALVELPFNMRVAVATIKRRGEWDAYGWYNKQSQRQQQNDRRANAKLCELENYGIEMKWRIHFMEI